MVDGGGWGGGETEGNNQRMSLVAPAREERAYLRPLRLRMDARQNEVVGCLLYHCKESVSPQRQYIARWWVVACCLLRGAVQPREDSCHNPLEKRGVCGSLPSLCELLYRRRRKTTRECPVPLPFGKKGRISPPSRREAAQRGREVLSRLCFSI